MKRFLFVFILCFSFVTDFSIAQNHRGNVKNFSLNILPVYENWSMEDSTSFSEFTSILSASYYFSANTNLGFSSQYAAVGGDVNKLSGLSDMQMLFSHYLENKIIGFQGGINIPSGKTKLSNDEFLTSRIISQNLFAVHTPNFGQGLNAFVGMTWTQPLSKSFVFGAGLSYQLKTEYQPLKDISEKYNPSNELSATGGFDVGISKTATITADVTGIFYGSDELDGKKVFKTGNRLISNLLYRQYFEHNILSLNLIYRHISVDEIEGSGPVLDEEKINPSQFYSAVSFNHRISTDFTINYGLFLILYEQTVTYFSGYTVFGIRLSPEFSVSPDIKIPVFIKVARGVHSDNLSLLNYQIGSGIKFNF